MKHIVLLILTVCNVFVVFAYKHIDLDDGQELFIYDDVKTKKYGFMNLQGEVIVPPIYTHSYTEVEEFYGGEPYPYEGTFTNGLARVYDEKRGYGFIDYRGVEVIPCKYKFAFPFNNGLAAVRTEDDKWGYIDITGKVIVPLQYYIATMHREGVAYIGRRGKYGEEELAIIDNKGNIITDFIFQSSTSDRGFVPQFSEGRSLIMKAGKRVCIDKTGKTLFGFSSEYCPRIPFRNGLAILWNRNNSDMVINKAGDVVFKSDYSLQGFSDDGLSIINQNNKFGVINNKFHIILPPIYDDLSIFNGFISCSKDGKYGVFDTKGTQIIPFKYDYIDRFDAEFKIANVKLNGKFGFINTEGEFVIPPVYDNVSYFEDGYALAQKGNLVTIIDIEQNPQIPYSSLEKARAQFNYLGIVEGKSDVDIHIPKSEINNQETIVLIISNEKYMSDKISNVQYAKNDGKSLLSYCQNTLGIPERNIMICEDATLSQLKSGINWLQRKTNLSNYRKAIIYFSGHGLPDYSMSDSYILPVDANPNDLTTAYSLSSLYNELSLLNVENCIAFIDACFSGADRGGKNINNLRGVSIKPYMPEPRGNVIVFSACQGDETAQPFPLKHHGVFTYFLLKYLQEYKGEGTLGDISDYVKSNVKETTLNNSGAIQNPTVYFPSNKSDIWRGLKLK